MQVEKIMHSELDFMLTQSALHVSPRTHMNTLCNPGWQSCTISITCSLF